MVYVTSDCHGNFQRFGMRYLPGQKAMDRNDYIIVCGDFGFWSDTPEEEYWLDWLEKKPFTILWVDGNHENFTRLNQLPVHEWHGGKVHFIRPHVIYLMQGPWPGRSGFQGAAVATAEYLHNTYHDASGFSPRNLRRMREFYRTYSAAPEVLA